MAARKKTAAKKVPTSDMTISKSRTKATAKTCNVASDFYAALDAKVKEIIRSAEKRALDNKRKTLRPFDL